MNDDKKQRKMCSLWKTNKWRRSVTLGLSLGPARTLGWNGRTVPNKGLEVWMTKQTRSRCDPHYSVSQSCFCKAVCRSPHICRHLRWQACYLHRDPLLQGLASTILDIVLNWGGKCLSCLSLLFMKSKGLHEEKLRVMIYGCVFVQSKEDRQTKTEWRNAEMSLLSYGPKWGLDAF